MSLRPSTFSLIERDRAVFLHGDLSARIIGAFFDAYNGIGFGYPETMCRNALVVELQKKNLGFAREVPNEVIHSGVPIGVFRFDLVVETKVLVEVKASKELTDADRRQIQSYLKASPFEVGLLMNFGPKPDHERYVYTNARK